MRFKSVQFMPKNSLFGGVWEKGFDNYIYHCHRLNLVCFKIGYFNTNDIWFYQEGAVSPFSWYIGYSMVSRCKIVTEIVRFDSVRRVLVGLFQVTGI